MNKLTFLVAILLIATGVAEAQRLRSFNLSVTVSGPGRVVSDLPGIDCPGTCQAKYNSGTNISLMANPESSATFSGWNGACTGGNSVCTIYNIDANKSVSADFSQSGGGVTLGSGFAVVDSLGKLVSTRITEDTQMLIEYTVDGVVHFANAAVNRNGLFLEEPTWYGTSDCSGQAYIMVFTPMLDRRIAVLAADRNDEPHIFYTALDAVPARLLARSYLYRDTTSGLQCSSYSQYVSVFSAVGKIRVADWWTPPFSWQ